MATLETVEVSYNRKVQLDQFEPIQHGAVLTVSVDENEDSEDVYDEYADRAEEMVERQIASRVAQKKLSEDTDNDESD